MQLKFVIPNMEETFGTLEFAGIDNVETRRISGRTATISRSYQLYSSTQRADNIIVTVPGKVGEKSFKPDDVVVLINPRITAEGKRTGNSSHANYLLNADDIQLATQ